MPHAPKARSTASPPLPQPVPAAARDVPTPHESRPAPGSRALARAADLNPAESASDDLSEHDKTPIVRNGVPGRARADSGRYSLLRHAQGRRVGWPWAAVGGSGDAARPHGRAGARQAAGSGQKWAHRRVPGARGRRSRARSACRRVPQRSIDLTVDQTPRTKGRDVEELRAESFSAPSSAVPCLAAVIRRRAENHIHLGGRAGIGSQSRRCT